LASQRPNRPFLDDYVGIGSIFLRIDNDTQKVLSALRMAAPVSGYTRLAGGPCVGIQASGVVSGARALAIVAFRVPRHDVVLLAHGAGAGHFVDTVALRAGVRPRFGDLVVLDQDVARQRQDVEA